MIRLSKLTDYAVALLSHMGNGGKDGLWTASDLTDKSGLPMPTVAKVLKILAKSGVVSAQRGAAGGYKLIRPASEISIATIIEAMDGPISITACADSSAGHQDCLISNVCPLSAGWAKVNKSIRGALEAVMLSEMGVPPHSFAMHSLKPSESDSGKTVALAAGE